MAGRGAGPRRTSTQSLALTTPRSGAGVAVARDPVVRVPGRAVYYLYAVGGNRGTEAAVAIDDGSEWMVVQMDTATLQTYAAGFQAGSPVTLTKPGGAVTRHGKWQAHAFAGTPDSIPYRTNPGCLYLAGGLRSSAAAEVFDGTHLFQPIAFGTGPTPSGARDVGGGQLGRASATPPARRHLRERVRVRARRHHELGRRRFLACSRRT